MKTKQIELVTIPQKVANAIEWALRTYGSESAVISNILDTSLHGKYTDLLREIPFKTLVLALVNGYELEKTAEQLAHDRIRNLFNEKTMSEHDRGVDAGITATLNILGIKIEGVNA